MASLLPLPGPSGGAPCEAPYADQVDGRCYPKCHAGYRADGDICDKIDLKTPYRGDRSPARARRHTICDPGWTWDGKKMCFPTCPGGYDTREELCVPVPHSYRRKPRPKLWKKQATVLPMPDPGAEANRAHVSDSLKHVVGETVSDAKDLIRSIYPMASIITIRKGRPIDPNEKPVINRMRLVVDPSNGLVTDIPKFG